jgi:hypothetical protein
VYRAGDTRSIQVVIKGVTATEGSQKIAIVVWNLRDLWIDVSLWQLFTDEHDLCRLTKSRMEGSQLRLAKS